MLSACYLLHFKPFENSLVQKLEVFNEVCSLVMLLLTFCMTDLVPSPEDRNIVGLFFIGCIALNIGTHLYFLFADVFVKLFRLIMNKCKKADRKSIYAMGQEK